MNNCLYLSITMVEGEEALDGEQKENNWGKGDVM